MIQTIKNVQQEIAAFQNVSDVDNFVQSVILQFKSGQISKETIDDFINEFGDDYFEKTIQGFAYKKPFGYAGDFKTIDRIYTFHKSDDSRYSLLDEYLHQQAAPQAVRNRKTYFKNFLKKKSEATDALELLNIASGPARDLLEFYNENQDSTVNTMCVEMEPQAVAYAKELNSAHLNKIDFVTANIFRFKTDHKFDVIWSAGLFDYFEDKAFVHVLKKMKRWIKPGGEIIIGNFNEDHNPSRDYMELFGDWYLHHRTIDQLIDLAVQAGFNPELTWVGQEDELVNLFLHIGVDNVN